MIDEKIIINKLEQIKINSRQVSKNKHITQPQFEYLLDKLIEFIESNSKAENNFIDKI